jgi:hypothetical protein
MTILLKYFPQPRATAGTCYCAVMIANTGFTLPFFGAAFGAEGFTKAIIYDIGNIFFIYTLIYYVAVRHGENKNFSVQGVLKKFLYMPPLWAFFLGLFFAMTQRPVPYILDSFLSYVSGATLPMIMLSLGLLFSPRLKNIPKAFGVIFIRMICGLIIGLGLTYLLPIDPLSKIVIVANCAAPCGYNTLVFASLERLDERFSATVVSMSILIGIFYIPLVFYFMK